MKYPLIPVKDFVLFENIACPIFVGRLFSVNATKIAIDKYHSKVVIVKQTDDDKDDINEKDIHDVGVLCEITQHITLPDNSMRLLVCGIKRVNINHIENYNAYFAGTVTEYDYKDSDTFHAEEISAFKRIIQSSLGEQSLSNTSFSQTAILSSVLNKNHNNIEDYFHYLNISIFSSSLRSDIKQSLLAFETIKETTMQFVNELKKENEITQLENKISNDVKKQMDDSQREYYLHEKIKAIKKELGENVHNDVEEYRKKLKALKLKPEVAEKISEEIKKLSFQNTHNAEYGILKTYLDTVFSLPWNKLKKSTSDIDKVEKFITDSHYGMEKVKERIIEYIAKRIYTKKNTKGSILCLYGHPGVGKTTISKSVADAMGLDFVKIALGGVRDEAEIRGHRKTYIGAMPGKIISSLKKAKSNNCVILLDEIDKIDSNGFKGDPASALLEALDPEQNYMFNDHYLDVDYDLSNVFFIATANSLDIPAALRDRMEIINVPSYLFRDKIEIATKYILPSKIKEHELIDKVIVTQDGLETAIKYYTQEAGVRELSRVIDKLLRKSIIEILKTNTKELIVINEKKVVELLGPKKYSYGVIDKTSSIGTVNGLAYTSVGGDSLVIEATLLPYGKGEIRSTGKLGDVMKESVQTAFSYIRSNAEYFNIDEKKMKEYDVHLHVPEGATPKDGPSAGITIATALLSVYTDKKVKNTVGMTGEITLTGKVLPIGGLREKLTSAIRAGIKTVIIPEKNEKDLHDVPDYVQKELKIVFASKYEDVRKVVFV